jgi:hypothetical protein
MNISKTIATVFCGAVLCLAFSTGAKADANNEKTIITFSGPVEVPGMVLPPGTYVFKLTDTLVDRNVVQVYNKDETHLYGTFLAIPDYRPNPVGKPLVTFEERAAGSPEAVRAWFYPGDNFGHEFVYPKVKAMELARNSHQNVPSMPDELAANVKKPAKTMTEPHIMAMKKAPLKAQKPTGEEVEIAEAFTPAPPASNTSQSASAPMPKHLPRTGSELPLLALIGLLSLGAGISLRTAGRQIG